MPFLCSEERDQRGFIGGFGPNKTLATAAKCVLSFFEAPHGRSRLPKLLLNAPANRNRREMDAAEWGAAFIDWALENWNMDGMLEGGRTVGGIGPRNYHAYTAPLILTSLLELAEPTGKVDELLGEKKFASAVEFLEALLSDPNRRGLRFAPGYRRSGFLTYWTARAMSKLIAAVDAQSDRADGQPDRIQRWRDLLRGMRDWADAEVDRQVSRQALRDLENYDSIQLGYALSIIDLYAEGLGWDPDRARVTGCLQLLFHSQIASGLWPRGYPIFHDDAGGSAYPFACEALTTILRLGFRPTQPEAARSSIDFFAPHLAGLLRVLEWVEENKVELLQAEGWRYGQITEHAERRPQPWATAAVFSFVLSLDFILRHIIRSHHLHEFAAVEPQLRGDELPSKTSWVKQFAETKTRLENEVVRLNDLIWDELIEPQRRREADRVWAVILSGPPGTGKTTLAERIATALGWPLVRLGAGDFLALGADKMVHQAQVLFRKLQELFECVILVDEAEEFFRTRDDEEEQPEVRQMTAAMLTLIQDLRAKERSLLLLNTNYPKRLDHAATRPGRFDMELVLLPPTADWKRDFMLKQLEKFEVGRELEQIFDKTSDCGEIIDRFTLKEWQLLIDRCRRELEEDLERDGRAVLDEDLVRSLLSQFSSDLTITEAFWRHYENRPTRMLKPPARSVALRSGGKDVYVRSRRASNRRRGTSGR